MNWRLSDQDIVVLRGARTSFGSFGGALNDVAAVELGVHAARGGLERRAIGAEEVDHVVFGNELRRGGGRYGLAARCIGGGRDLAMILEAIHG
jgi:acetyl-CoA acetyltransferase